MAVVRLVVICALVTVMAACTWVIDPRIVEEQQTAADIVVEEVAAEIEEVLQGIETATIDEVAEQLTSIVEQLEVPGEDLAPDDERICKGNINRSGERIYHCPGQVSYERTVVTEARGEIWCTPSECIEAGFRPALR